MSKKHYVELARILREHEVSDRLLRDLCGVLKQDNRLFSAQRFVEAVRS